MNEQNILIVRCGEVALKGMNKPYFEKTGVACPKCGGDVVYKMTKKGRRYFGCINNPECDFMSWSKPSDKKCPKCGAYMVEKGNKLLCSAEKCGYVMSQE